MIGSPHTDESYVIVDGYRRPITSLSDVPLDILEAIKKVYKENKPQAVELKGKNGNDSILVFEKFDTYVIWKDGGLCIAHENRALSEVGFELATDIESELEGWANWEIYTTKRERKDRETYFRLACNEIKKKSGAISVQG